MHLRKTVNGAPDSDFESLFINSFDGNTNTIEKTNDSDPWRLLQISITQSLVDQIWINDCVEVEKENININTLVRDGAY